MASSFSSDLKLELMATGENAGTWGDKTNTNLNLVQQAVAGFEAIDVASADVTLAMTDATISNARNATLKFTGTLAANRTVTLPDSIEKVFNIEDGTDHAGNTLTFTGAPDTGAEIEIKHLAVRSIIRRAPDFQLDTFTGDGSDTTFTLANSGVPTNSAFVFVNGSAMTPTTDYTINGNVLTFTSAPANSAVILVRYQI